MTALRLFQELWNPRIQNHSDRKSLSNSISLASDKPILVVLRGLPGVGKSTFCKALEEKLNLGRRSRRMRRENVGCVNETEAHAKEKGSSGSGTASSCYEKTCVCSADKFFETRGLPFNTEALQRAHDWCREEFMRGVGRRLDVIVDNTNTRLQDFKFYLRQACKAQYDICVVEVVLGANTQIQDIQSRGKHQVPKEAYRKMLYRWEPYENAIRLIAYEQARSRESKGESREDETKLQRSLPRLSGEEGMSLQRWMVSHHVFHFQKKRKTSHIAMAVGVRPFMFVDIPHFLIAQFHRIYARAVACGSEGAFLCECATPVFRLFFDIDMEDVVSSRNELMSTVEVARNLQNVLRSLFDPKLTRLIVCKDNTNNGNGLGPSNFHIHCPDILLDTNTALKVRHLFVKKLIQLDHRLQWNKIVDEGVFSNHQTLRMLFSRKATKGIDVGRAYDLYCALDSEGRRDEQRELEYRADLVSLLNDVSIRCSENEKRTPANISA
eukprot:CAMPEP_0184494594 /NCGR_PEP_ID=MMETSP0113_2-20130426/29099_1 /TAXON_ID=91329 /ORGANISM="Norrisiella sphaerica, Strain BC52" /LENGTH=495 /DNA_ID=CAMNT_0026880411 /DNA_START=183 /DNA_END=1670 /DNA_ORIENTATION=+